MRERPPRSRVLASGGFRGERLYDVQFLSPRTGRLQEPPTFSHGNVSWRRQVREGAVRFPSQGHCRRLIRGGAAGAAAILCASSPVLTQNSSRAFSEDTPELNKIFSAASRQSDYIVVIDRSGSMAKYWQETRAALRAFIDGVPDGDYVSIIFFAKSATNNRIIPRTLTASSRRALFAELERIPPPGPTDGGDEFRYTDLGEGLAATLDELNRPGASPLRFVFLLTDFKHDPSPASRFETMDLQSPVWTGLESRGKQLRAERPVETFAILLPLDREAGRDLNMARLVLGDLKEIRADAGTLREWFSRRAAEIQRIKLAALARADIARGWGWETVADENQTRAAVLSRLRHLPLSVALARVDMDGIKAQTSSRVLTIPPGARSSIVLSQDGCTTRLPWWKWLMQTGSTRPTSVAMAFTGSLTAEPQRELRRIGVDPSLPLNAPTRGNAAVSRCGAPRWLQAAVGVALLVGGFLVWRTWIRSAAPVSATFRRIALNAPSGSETLQIPPRSGLKVVLGNTPTATVRTKLDEPPFELTFTSRRPRFPLLAPRRALFAHASAGTVLYLRSMFNRVARKREDLFVPLPSTSSGALEVSRRSQFAVERDGLRITIKLLA